MRLFFVLLALFGGITVSRGQYGGYTADSKTAGDAVKAAAFKNGYQYLITFEETNAGAINVNKQTNYLVVYVYQNPNNQAVTQRAHLMTPDSVLLKQYSAKPDNLGRVGTAAVSRLRFRTRNFNGGDGDTRPVKFEANPKATIYVFYKKA
ncbi:hypothetical protein [Flavihumibacter petaseus]|nr:hypothetical protein [Flavihumibacter petaseus]